MRIDLNADVGESFGRWRLGDDEAILDVITSANVACGFHAGDPLTLSRTVASAVERGVSIGAQVSYRDLAGFIYPKLLRTEVSGVDGNAIKVEHTGAGLERLTGLLDRLAAQAAAGRAAEPTDGSGN